MKAHFKHPRKVDGKEYKKGEHELPDSHADHWYVQALIKQGDVTLVEAPKADPKAEAAAKAKADAEAKAKAEAEELAKMEAEEAAAKAKADAEDSEAEEDEAPSQPQPKKKAR